MNDPSAASPRDERTPHRTRPTSLGRRRASTALLAIASLVAALALGEAGLRLIGFRYELRLHMIESTAPNPGETVRLYRIDRELAWVPQGYQDSLRAARAARPRLVFLGDSCTQLGWYDEYVVSFAAMEHPGARLRAAKLGCAGYTTRQGLAQLERDILPLAPRVVTLYYGWNDHWLSIGADDEYVSRLNASPLFRLRSLRVVQLVAKVAITLERRRHERVPLRVSPEQFRSNLVRMVRAAQAAGVVPLLITAPSSHVMGREPKYLENRWIDDLTTLVPLHRRYMQIVREVAAEERAPLCDLAAEFDAISQHERDVMFNADGIHANDDGNRAIAAGILGCLQSHGLLQDVLE